MSDKVKTTKIRDTILLREHRYDSGMVEIGVYIQAITPGVQPILTGVVSSQKVEGMRRKWHAYDVGNQPRVSHHLKSRVVDAAISWAEAKAMEHRKRFGAPLGVWPEQFN